MKETTIAASPDDEPKRTQISDLTATHELLVADILRMLNSERNKDSYEVVFWHEDTKHDLKELNAHPDLIVWITQSNNVRTILKKVYIEID